MDDIRQTAIDRFRAYLERRQFSAHTVASYTLDLRLFFAEVAVPLAHKPGQHILSTSAELSRLDTRLPTGFPCFFAISEALGQPVGGRCRDAALPPRGRPIVIPLSSTSVRRLRLLCPFTAGQTWAKPVWFLARSPLGHC